MDPSQNLQFQQMMPRQSIDSSADASPQDVLAEARKNLQALIDSGISKDLLHQWVDDSLSLQLALPSSTLSSSQSPHASQHAPPPPPPPQCAPPPPPPQSVVAHNHAPAPMSTDIKTEPMSDDMPANWPSASTLGSTPNGILTSMDSHTTSNVPNMETMFYQLPLSSRARISVSSTSSGSSGRASIWSNNSAQSTYSWQSSGSARSMAPLPMPPSSASNMPILNGTQLGTTAQNANRQNIYWCTSCETSFKRKYDWKRHEDEFHERWRKYPCPEPGCNRCFWGSNSFNQHHKQCHGCKTCPHADEIVKLLRKRKYWACGFCSALHPARERHVEHVARHFEAGKTKADWMHSRVIYGLLHQPLMRNAWESLRNTKAVEEFGGRRPQLSWDPSKTGRAQGFLEDECPGQLQDCLEFFSGDVEEAVRVVHLAYDLADIVVPQVQNSSPHFANTAGSMSPPQHDQQHASFAPLPSQTHQQPQMLPQSNSPSGHQSFASSFPGAMFVPSQSFSAHNQTSPESSSQSPLTTSQSPMGATGSPMDRHDMHQSTSGTGNAGGDSMMEYEYSAPTGYENWTSLGVHGDSAAQQQQRQRQGSQSDWGMYTYYSSGSRASQ